MHTTTTATWTLQRCIFWHRSPLSCPRLETEQHIWYLKQIHHQCWACFLPKFGTVWAVQLLRTIWVFVTVEDAPSQIGHIISVFLGFSWLSRFVKNRHSVFSERELKFTFAICHRPSVCLSSVVCNVGAPYSGDWNFRQCFYAMWYLGHPLPLCKNFTEIVPGEPLRRGVKPKRGSKI